MATTSVSAKTCSVCGKDVSGERRTRDTSNRYYCQPCYASAVARKSAEQAVTVSQIGHAPKVPATTNAVTQAHEATGSPRPTTPAVSDIPAPKLDEYDAFLDPVVLQLIRHQVEPEALLGVCDVRPPIGTETQTILLTPSRLVFVMLRSQAGQSEVVPGRQMALSDLERAALTTSRPSARGRERFHLLLATRDRIENWTSEYSALSRIASAISDIKAGRTVTPTIRTTDDLAAMRAREPQSGRSPHPALMTALYWLDHLVIPPLRATRNVAALWATWIAIAATVASSLVIGMVAVIILPTAIATSRSVDVSESLVIISIAIALSLVGLPNAICCSKRLKSLRAGDQTPLAPMQRPDQTQGPWAMPWTKIMSVAAPVAILLVAMIWLCVSRPDSSSGDTPSSSSGPGGTTPLPEITITGNDVGVVKFTGWSVHGTRLTGTVQYIGDAAVQLTYKVMKDEVLMSSGTIMPPTGGELIMSHQPMSITVPLPSRSTVGVEVEVQAMGG